MEVLIDNRWDGNSGIGRVLRENVKRIPKGIVLTPIEVNVKEGSPFSPIALTRALNKSKADVFYSPSWMAPISFNRPIVITIHDLFHLYFYKIHYKLYFKYLVGFLAARASKVIAVSNFTKVELIEKLGLKPGLIEVIYNGLDDSFIDNQERYEIGRPYFLYVGNRRIHKNLERMLEAFSVARIPKEYIFAISGENDNAINEIILRLGIVDRIVFLGRITETDLAKVYKGAYAVLYVSLMEGFGLPVLEAMGSRTPVISSNLSSIPEIAGDAAVLVDPYSVFEIKEAIELLIEDKGLYDELCHKGLERVKLFSWDKTANLTWQIVQDSLR